MPADIRNLIASAVESIQLKILVFGPQVHTRSTIEKEAKLQRKRIEIRNELEALGHFVRYAEDLVDPQLSGSAGNAFFQELVIMQEYDLIVTIVETPGSIVEATTIALNPKLAQKSALFLDEGHLCGLPAQACRNAEDMGAYFATYEYPIDLDECHLFGHVLDRVQKTQKIKYLL